MKNEGDSYREHKIKITATAFRAHDNDFVEIDTNILGSVSREIASLKDEMVKKALIDLGWTPPKTTKG